jgi:hypothetical protein
VDATYYGRIQAAELVSLAWTGPDKWERAPGVVAFTQRFNNVRTHPPSPSVQASSVPRRLTFSLSLCVCMCVWSSYVGL